ncbi:helix-turn-helix domain-containing protein [Duncaniella dubosii]|uniref:helix-turn-helix domain-containing protein n=1 Tax=Duncaniella dubosii TaxID=2518971 RepID=UPI003F666942
MKFQSDDDENDTMKLNKNRNKYDSPAYWTQLIQLSLQDNIRHYLEEKHLTQSEFAERLGVSKGYISQILNGDFDHKLSKLTQLALACEMVPRIEFVPKQHSREVAYESYIRPADWKHCTTYTRKLNFHTVRPQNAKYTELPDLKLSVLPSYLMEETRISIIEFCHTLPQR